MFLFCKNLVQTRWFWTLLMLFGLIMEACGLYFQYGLNLQPCVFCVYERALFLGFVLIGFIGIFTSYSRLRLIPELCFTAISVSGILIAYQHYAAVHSSGFGAVCKLRANFPSFLPLDEWLPWMFMPTGSCGPLPWSLLGLDMPQWLLIIFIAGSLVAIFILLSELLARRANQYDQYYR